MSEDYFDSSFWQISGKGLSVKKRKIALVCSRSNLDQAMPALVLGVAALGEKAEVEIFFTFWGLDVITKRTMDNLMFTFQGNTGMHVPVLEKIRPGWGKRSLPQFLGVIPGMTRLSTAFMRKNMKKNNIPPVRDLLEQIVEMGGRLWACSMTMEMMGLGPNQLWRGVSGVLGAPDFIRRTDGAQIIFI